MRNLNERKKKMKKRRHSLVNNNLRASFFKDIDDQQIIIMFNEHLKNMGIYMDFDLDPRVATLNWQDYVGLYGVDKDFAIVLETSAKYFIKILRNGMMNDDNFIIKTLNEYKQQFSKNIKSESSNPAMFDLIQAMITKNSGVNLASSTGTGKSMLYSYKSKDD